ncbi:hypothetical protein TRICHSKD4_3870 [Roseibium sp. TrichSKD4]|nr:hypothetical protein TRICHSKD4_3870 [Roseibium sp. TrichSKD4]
MSDAATLFGSAIKVTDRIANALVNVLAKALKELLVVIGSTPWISDQARI